jgi:hypothetical protein
MSAEHDRTHAIVLVEFFHRVSDLLDQFHVKEIMRRTLHLDCADKARVLADADILIVRQVGFPFSLEFRTQLNSFLAVHTSLCVNASRSKSPRY